MDKDHKNRFAVGVTVSSSASNRSTYIASDIPQPSSRWDTGHLIVTLSDRSKGQGT